MNRQYYTLVGQDLLKPDQQYGTIAIVILDYTIHDDKNTTVLSPYIVTDQESCTLTQLVGRRLGRYEIQQEIGRGGMARVYRAVDTLLQRPVAIKVLAPQLGMDPEFARRFEREAITAANLRHPAIVTIYDVGEKDGLHFIAMEFVHGRSLHAILEDRGALGLGYAISILDPLAQALDYAHSRGAVHRDVKPHNVLIDRDGRVLLTDFGIAQMPDADTERLTRTGVFMGTPEYISPEQAQASRVDGRSDLYSLGVVAYEIITGRVPFSGATPQLIIAHAQTPPPPPSRIAPHIPGELDLVFMRALAKDAALRYSNGATMVAALQAIAHQHGIPLASSQQIADLVKPADSSGQPTISLGKDQATAASHPPVVAPPPLVAAAPVAQPSGHSSIPPVPPPPAAPAVPTAPPPASSVRYPARQSARQPGNNTLNRTILLLIIGLILLMLLALLLRGWSSDANSVMLPTATLPGDAPAAPIPGGEVVPPPLDVAPTETATPAPASPIPRTIATTTPTPVPTIVPASPPVIIPPDTMVTEPPLITTEPELLPTEPPPTEPPISPTPTDTSVVEPEPSPEATATPVPPATEPTDTEPPSIVPEPPPPPPSPPPPPDQYPGPIVAPTMSTTMTETAITPALPPLDRPTDSFTPVPPATPIPTTPPVPDADLPGASQTLMNDGRV